MNYSLLRSRTFWSLVALFVVNGGNAVVPVLTPDVQVIVNLILGFLVTYFHLKTGQSTTGAN